MDIVELRYVAVQCHLLATRCDDPARIAELHRRGDRCTALAEAMVERAKEREASKF